MLILVIFILQFATFIAASCPSDYIEFKSKCYFVSLNSTKFAAAELICREKGGHLISVHDRFTNAFIAEQNSSDFWIGLTNLQDSSSWKWTDNSNLDYQDWNDDSNLNNSNKNCASLNNTDKKWYTEDCYETKIFICQFLKEPICEDGFVYFPETQSCYGCRSKTYYSNWTQAEDNCKITYNAHLPVIESFAEFQLVATYVSEIFQGYWVGIYFSNESQTWVTINGKKPEFLNWCPGYPQHNETGRCVQIGYVPPHFCYADLDCGWNSKIRYLCKKNANFDFKYRYCPSSLIEWNSKCYFVSQNESEFDEADISCMRRGGNLVSIHDGFQNAFVSQLFYNTTPDAWIGLSNSKSSAEWEWLDESSFNYHNWLNAEIFNGFEPNCISASSADGKWRAQDCNKRKPFVCEIRYQVPNCSEGWFYFSATQSCYGIDKHFVHQNRRGYSAAQMWCTNVGANLPSIHSEYEFQLILSFAYVIWYGQWLGIRSFDGGKTWETDDGSAADFLEYGKWCKGSAPTQSNELCVALQPLNEGGGCYQAVDCPNGTSHGFFFVCQKKVSFLSSILSSSSTVPSSPFSTHVIFTTIESTTANTHFGEREKKSNYLWYIGGGAVIIVLIIIVTAVFIYHKLKGNTVRQRRIFNNATPNYYS